MSIRSSQSRTCTGCASRTRNGKSQYAGILDELEQPELLYLSLLLHDTGKGAQSENHVEGSLAHCGTMPGAFGSGVVGARNRALSDWQSSGNVGRTAPRYLRFASTVAAFVDKVGTPERLKMLCLFTYADIKAVNPDALTPWKAENVWQLYIAAANQLNRNVDQRLHSGADLDDEKITRLRALAPSRGQKSKSFSRRIAAALLENLCDE